MLLVSLRQLLKEKLDFNSSRSPVQKGQHPLGHSVDRARPQSGSWLCLSLAGCVTKGSSLAPLRLNFCICKWDSVVVPTLWGLG